MYIFHSCARIQRNRNYTKGLVRRYCASLHEDHSCGEFLTDCFLVKYCSYILFTCVIKERKRIKMYQNNRNHDTEKYQTSQNYFCSGDETFITLSEACLSQLRNDVTPHEKCGLLYKNKSVVFVYYVVVIYLEMILKW